MVHALSKTRKLLPAGGLLIEVHDRPIPPSLSLIFPDETVTAGRLLDHSGFKELQSAASAVDDAVRSKLFTRIDFKTIDYEIHIDSIDSFEEWRDRQWDSTYLKKPREAFIRESIGKRGQAGMLKVSRSCQVSVLMAS